MSVLSRSVILGLSLVSSSLFAEDSCTAAVGYVTTTALAQSDISTGTSLVRSPVYVGKIENASGSTIAVTGNPGWMLGEFTYAGETQPNTYYARVGGLDGEDGPYTGRIFTVEVAGNNVLIVTDPIDGPLDSLLAGAGIEIIPYWTLNTLFPSEDAGVSFVPTETPMEMKTMVVFRDHDMNGINIPLSKFYYFRDGKWRLVGGAYNDDFGDTIIHPNKPFTIRNPDTTPLEIRHLGQVQKGTMQVQVRSQADRAQDTHLTTGVPVPVKLRELNLANTPAFRSCTGPFNIQDMLMLYDNEKTGHGKSASVSYYNVGGVWKKAGGSYASDFGDDIIPPDASFFIRREAIPELTPVFWRTGLLE